MLGIRAALQVDLGDGAAEADRTLADDPMGIPQVMARDDMW